MDFQYSRKMMVEAQLRANAITDKSVIKAFLTLPREEFLPSSHQGLAYMDADIALGDSGRFILKPMIMAKMIQAAGLEEGGRVLEIGCGTGYGCAILSLLHQHTYGLESQSDLYKEAASKAKKYSFQVARGDLSKGLSTHAPFDRIFIFAQIEELTDTILRQLKNQGKLICLMPEQGVSKAVVFYKTATGISKTPLFDATGPKLSGFQKARSFEF